MKNAGKRNVALGSCVFLTALTVLIVLLFLRATDRLTEEQIADLRGQYPICEASHPLVSFRENISLEECIRRAESFVYGEVVGEASYYQVSRDLGDGEFQEKQKANGVSDVNEFYEYTLRVLDDTEGRYTPDTEITISANVLLKDSYPALQEGMRVVVPVVRDDSVTTRNYYTVHGMFYVTEEEYALSAYEEPDTEKPVSGQKVDALMGKLKK